MGRAIRGYFEDLAAGDPIAVGLTIFFGLLLAVVAIIWIVDLVKRNREKKRQSQKRRPPVRRERE
jgi:hypothetical protein